MDILQVISSSAFLGAERVICELASQSNSRMHICLLGARPALVQEFQDCLGDEFDRLHNITCGRKISLSGLLGLRKLMRNHDFGIVHSHGYKADTISWVVRTLWFPKMRLVSSCHTWKLNTAAERFYKTLNIFILRRFHAIVAISQEIKDELVKGGVTSEIEIINNGVDLNQFAKPPEKADLRGSLGLAAGDTVIGCVASLTPEKRQIDLIQAVALLRAQYRNLRLVLVGDGPSRKTLVDKVDELDIREHVLFLGHRSDARALFFAFDIFALVSTIEGLPMALLEAMAAGVAVVVSDVGAIPSVVQNRENGVLVRSGAVEEICDAFRDLVEDGELRGRLARAGLESIVSRYSSKAMSEAYDKIYAGVVSGTEKITNAYSLSNR